MDATLVAVVAVALFFDFTNGFHDTANSIATSVSTRALGPRPAVAMAAVLNFAGAFVSFEVAATIAKGIVDQDAITLDVILAGLVGAITWNLVTWFLGLPSSSSHALIGGMIGSAVMASGWDVVKWEGLKDKVLIPSLAAPFLGIVIAFVLILAITWLIARRSPSRVNHVFRRAQLVSGGFVAFTHGTNDAQKTMGIIALALVARVTSRPTSRARRRGSSSRQRSRWPPARTSGAGGSSGRSASASRRSTRRRDSPLRPRARASSGRRPTTASRSRRRTRSRGASSAPGRSGASPRCVGASPATSSSPGC